MGLSCTVCELLEFSPRKELQGTAYQRSWVMFPKFRVQELSSSTRPRARHRFKQAALRSECSTSANKTGLVGPVWTVSLQSPWFKFSEDGPSPSLWYSSSCFLGFGVSGEGSVTDHSRPCSSYSKQ